MLRISLLGIDLEKSSQDADVRFFSKQRDLKNRQDVIKNRHGIAIGQLANGISCVSSFEAQGRI
jgi:hypothetical protein